LPEFDKNEAMATRPTPLRASAHHGYKSYTTTYYDAGGHRRTKRFGRVDEVSKKVAVARYQKWLASEWTVESQQGDPNAITVTRLCEAYRKYAEQIYRKNGKPTSTIIEVNATMDALISNLGNEPTEGVTAPMIVKFINDLVVTRKKHPFKKLNTTPLTVSTINGRLRIIKRCFAWGRQQDMVSREAAIDVTLVSPLRANRSQATATEPVTPVPVDILNKTIEASPKTIADMIRVQVLTGMRPGELCMMRPADIDVSDKVWIYKPQTHKTEHHGRQRFIPIGPQAQRIIKPYIAKRKPMDTVFTPEDAHRERLERAGKPKYMAFQMSRSTFKPGRAFDNGTYRNAIQRECDRVWDWDGKKRENGDYSHRWHPHQLRHNAATAIRETLGIEAASDVLGHSTLNMTATYAEKTIARLKEIAKKVG